MYVLLVDKYDEWMIQMKERSLLRIVWVIFKTLKMKEAEQKTDRRGCSANTKTKRRQSRKKDAIYSFLSCTFTYIYSALKC